MWMFIRTIHQKKQQKKKYEYTSSVFAHAFCVRAYFDSFSGTQPLQLLEELDFSTVQASASKVSKTSVFGTATFRQRLVV